MKRITKYDFNGQATGKKWPFKDLRIDEGVELPNGHNGKSVNQIRKYAFNYASSAGRKFTSQIVFDGNIQSVQILRIK